MSEKTELPSPKRIRDARRKGQFARSRLFSSAIATLCGFCALAATGPASAASFSAWARRLFLEHDLSPREALFSGLQRVAWLAAPVAAASFLGALVASTAMAGFQFTPNLAAPQLDRISPAAGLRKLFSARQCVEVVKALAVAALVLFLVWGAVRDAGPLALRVIRLDGDVGLRILLQRLAHVVLRVSFVLLALGVGDYLWARRRHIRDLMVSREDRKKEHKESEGDPHQKGKRKALHRQLLQGGRARGVQSATCIVVNPTHIAVALRYDEGESDAPYIVAKGREEDAFGIRKEAKRLGIPVVKDIPLARSLIHYDVGEEVPEELYKAAAAVLAVALDLDSHPRSET